MEVKNKDEIDCQFNKLWNEYEPYIRKLCTYKLSSMPDHIDDCVQESFKALLAEMTDGTVIKYPKTWLSIVANNKIKDLYSQTKIESGIFVPLTDPASNTASYIEPIQDDEVSEEKIDDYLKQILDGLTPDERELFEDRYVKHIKEKTIARKRGVTENLIQQQVFRLKRKIIKKLKQLTE